MSVQGKENAPAVGLNEVQKHGFMTFSPPAKLAPAAAKKKGAASQQPAAAIAPVSLVLKQFAEVPWVNFGSVSVGTTATAVLTIENDGNAAAATVTVDKAPPVDKGFVLEGCGEAGAAIKVGAKASKEVTITWTPAADGNVRETMLLKWQGKSRLQVRPLPLQAAAAFEMAWNSLDKLGVACRLSSSGRAS